MGISAIQHYELDANAATINFNNIPQTYTDLYLVVSGRLTDSVDATYPWYPLQIRPNDLTTNLSAKRLYGTGGMGTTGSQTFTYVAPEINPGNSTANTFSTSTIYISDYTSSDSKIFSIDSVSESSGSNALQMILSGFWNSTDPITSLVLYSHTGSGSIAQYTAATLYGITPGSDGITTVS